MSGGFKFSPTVEFTWTREYDDGTSRVVGTYHPNNTYNCTTEPRHDALREKCKEWVEEGKIVIHLLPPGTRFASKTGA